MHKLVITQAHFQCGPLIAPTEITFTPSTTQNARIDHDN